MSNLQHDHARDQLRDLAAGAPERTFASVEEVASECKRLSATAEQLFRDCSLFYSSSDRFVKQFNPSLPILCGMLKNVDIIAQATDKINSLCERQQKPPSFRTLLEVLISVKLFVQGQSTGEFSIECHGFEFVSTGKAIPVIPPKSQPQDRQKFFSWLRDKGWGDLIVEGQDVPFRELSKRLSSLLETPNPWPDWLRAYVAPAVKMKQITAD